MRLLALLASLYFPLCATIGAAGLTPPGVVDFRHLYLKGHSEALIAPPGVSPPPNFAAPVFCTTTAALFADLQNVATAQPRTYPLDSHPEALQAAWVIRTAAFNFPDIVKIAVVPAGPGKSSFILYSHSTYGWWGFGVNRNRALTWLKDLNMKVDRSCAVP